jgi:protocatechuate 3,4-dioxygenase beta subunit
MAGVLHTIVALILAAAAQTPPSPATETSAATIRGRVVDRESGAPISGANVSLDFLGPGTQKRLAVTTSDGEYVFGGLPPGVYNLLAEPAAGAGIYLSQRYGQSERVDPAANSLLTSGLRLASGDAVTANIELSKALFIEGRVVGDNGDPVARMRVDLARLDAPGSAAPVVRTDERGVFRLGGVRPGDYRVCADPGLNFSLARTPGRFEGAHPIRTCYRGGSHEDGGVVAVTNAPLTGVEIVLHRTHLFSVSGSALDSAGRALAGAGFSFMRRDQLPVSSIDINRTADGRFVVRGVPPGEYEIRVWTGMAGQPSTSGPEIGRVAVDVTDADVAAVVVQTRRPVSVAGRIEFEGGVPSRRPNVNINFARRELDALSGSRPPVHVGEDLRFRLDGVFGPVVLRVFGGMRPWVVKAIRYRGEDIYGRLVEFSTSDDPDNLVVVLTDKGAAVSGHVAAPAQGTRPNAMVFLVAVGTGKPEQLLVTDTSTAVEKDGSYRLPLVRAGEYLLFAVPVDQVSDGLWARAPAAVARFAKSARRISLRENDDQTIDLELAGRK